MENKHIPVGKFKSLADSCMARLNLNKTKLAYKMGMEKEYFSRLYNGKMPVPSHIFERLKALSEGTSSVTVGPPGVTKEEFFIALGKMEERLRLELLHHVKEIKDALKHPKEAGKKEGREVGQPGLHGAPVLKPKAGS